MPTYAARPIIDTAWHPLADGNPPEWASGWGQDRFGVFIEFTLGEINHDEVTQRLRWIPPGRFWMGSPEAETHGLARNDSEQKWFEREHPRHEVFITEGFWLFDTPCLVPRPCGSWSWATTRVGSRVPNAPSSR